MNVFMPLFIIVAFLILISVKVIYQYQKGVKFRLGSFVGILEPGVRIVIPIIESMRRMDMRIVAVDVPPQESITKDNVPVKVNAVTFFKIDDAAKAVLEVENYFYAVSQFAQSTLRSVIGQFELDTLLQKREIVGEKIRKIIDEATDSWGIDVTAVEVKDIELPQDMKRSMAKQAEAERERKRKVIMSRGELQASENLQKAAKILSEHPGGFHLRTLQTVAEVSPEQNHTYILPLPIEFLKVLEKIHKGDIKIKIK